MREISELLKGKMDCGCGREHTCPVEQVYIGKNAVEKLPDLTAGYRNILLVADENTWRAAGKEAAKMLGERVRACCVFSVERGFLIPDEIAIHQLEAALFDACDLILGIGSGVINDLCKYVSHSHGLPYDIFATAPSMDGFASVGAALILRGMKITLDCRPPRGIYADTVVLAASPLRMRQAGWGDIIGKYSCLNDWRLAACLRGEYFCPYVHDIMMEAVARVRPLAAAVRAGEETAVAQLMEALVIAGIAMTNVGNSRPASGSEHHLSHYFEITGILRGTEYLPHGIDVLCSAVLTAELREQMCARSPQKKSLPDWKAEIQRIYGTSAEEIVALQEKTGFYPEGKALPENWTQVKEILADAPGKQEMLELVGAIGLDHSEFTKLYGAQTIADGILYAKDLKNRYTCLWVWYHWFA